MTIRKLALLGFGLLFWNYSGLGQCSEVPVVEAVRNGDFELGYLPGAPMGTSGTKAADSHDFTTGGSFDFWSDLGFAGEYQGSNSGCWYNLANLYGVAKIEDPRCTNGNKSIPYADYGSADGRYTDHTTGTEDGFSLFFDFNMGDASWQVVWGQKVDVFPSQLYYFSAWFGVWSNTNLTTPPTLRFRVEFLDGSDNVINTSLVDQVVGSASPTLGWGWQQFSDNIGSPSNAVSANIYIECDPTGLSGQDDLIIDDISFINGCQNIESDITYSIDFSDDSVNLCLADGEYTAQLLDDNGSALTSNGTQTIKWYEGTGTSQTELTTFEGNLSISINDAGNYRACVYDPANNGCAVNTSVEVVESFEVDLDDLVLCDPASYDLDAGVDIPNNAITSISWSGASGSDNDRSYTVDTDGTHSVTVTGETGYDCDFSASFEVDNLLPVAPTNLRYCEGGGTSTSLTVDGLTPYAWYEDAARTTELSNSTTPDVDVIWTPSASTSGDQIFYIVNAETAPLTGSPIQNTVPNEDGVDNSSITIEVFSAVTLKSVKLSSPGYANGQTGTISLGSNSKNVTAAGNATFDLGWVLTPGTYTLSHSGFRVLKFGYGLVVSNETIPDYVTVSGSEVTFFDFEFEESSACAPVAVTVKAESCCTPPVEDPSLNSGASVLSACEGATSGLSVVSNTITAGLDFIWQFDDGSGYVDVGSSGTASGGAETLTGISAEGDYRIKIAEAGNIDKSCVKLSEPLTVVLNPLPTGSISIDETEICDDGSATVTLSASGGSGPYDYEWTEGATPGSQDNEAGDHTFAASAEQTYTLTGVTDANGCEATDLGTPDNVTLSHFANVSANNPVTDCPNGTDPNFDISVTLSGGQGAGSYVVTATDDLGVNVTANGSLSGSTWTMTGVSEDRSIDLSITDGNGCNPVTFSDVNEKCSCPESATLTVSGDAQICVEGAVTASELTVSFDDGTGVAAPSPTGSTSFFFQLLDQDDNVVADYSSGSANGSYDATGGDFVLPGITAGTYRVIGLEGDGVNGCPGSGGSSVTITEFDSPAAAMTGSTDKCDDGTSEATISIDVTAGDAPYSFEYSGTVSGASGPVATSDDPYTFTTTNAETFTWTSFTDANGCTAASGDLTADAVISPITPPTATISGPASSDTYQTGTDVITLVVDDPGVGYAVTWSITNSGQGSLANDQAISTDLTGLTAKDPDAGSTTEVTVSVVDDGGLCAAATDVITVIRVNQTIANLNDAEICGSTQSYPYTFNGGDPIDGIETASLLQDGGGIATVDANTGDITIASNPGAGTYTIELEIATSLPGLDPSTSTMILTVDGDAETASVSDGLTSVTTCVDTKTLQGVAPGQGRGEWTTVGPGSVTDPTNATSTISGLTEGSNTTATWTVYSEHEVCDATDIAIEYIKAGSLTSPLITISGGGGVFAGDDVSGSIVDICDNENYTLSAPSINAGIGEELEWARDVASGTNTSIPEGASADQVLSLDDPAASNARFTLTIKNDLIDGCDAEETFVEIALHAAPTADILDTYPSEICEGNDIDFERAAIGATDTDTWSVSTGTIDATGVSVSATGQNPVVNTITLIVDNDGCAPDQDDVTVTVNEAKTLAFTTVPTGNTICVASSGNDYTVAYENLEGGSIAWSGYTGIESETSATATIDDAVEGSYTISVTLTSGYSCPLPLSGTVTETFDVEVVPGPEPVISDEDFTICQGSSQSISVSKEKASNVIAWYLDGVEIVGADDESYSVSESGEYYYTEWNGVCAAVESNRINVNVENQTAVRVQDDFDICFDGSAFKIGGTGSGANGTQWLDGSSTAIGTNVDTISVTPLVGGTYVYTLRALGDVCPNSEESVTIQVRSSVQVPTVFTPNGDGYNDVFEMPGIETYPEAIVRIYNRWGQVVHETYKDYAGSPWAGTNQNGAGFEVGTFYYVIDLADGGACGEGKQGWVEIMK